MFKLDIAGVKVIFSKFFAVGDREAVLAAIPQGTRRVVFIDTPATPHLVATVESLVSMEIEAVVRDHHNVSNPRNSREQEIHDAANHVRELIGGNATISNRQAHPACSGLIKVGEFADEGTVIVADPDPDGLTAAMKAVGVTYPELGSDAAVLDGPRAGQSAETLSPAAWTFVQAMATLPPFNSERPAISEEAKGKLFSEFAAAATGDTAALDSLNRKVEAYEAGVREAEAIATTATESVTGVVLVDTVGKHRLDLATLAAKMEALPGCKVTVVRKDNGPIAAKHGGMQFSLAVIKAHQAEVNLQELLAPGFVSSPEAGIISNTTFLLHVSEAVWQEMVLPALKAKFA